MALVASRLRVSIEQPSLGDLLRDVCELPGVLLTMLRSMVDAWPDEVYSHRIVETRLLGQRTHFVVDPLLIRLLLVDQASSLEREAFMSRALSPALGTGLLTSDGALWRQQRRATAPVFRPDHIRTFVPGMAAAAMATRDRWRARSQEPAPFDLTREMMRTAFDIIVATMTSGEPGLDAARFAIAMEDYLGQTNWKMAYVMMGIPAWLPHPGSRRGVMAAHELRNAVSGLVVSRRARGVRKSDLLGLLLDARDPETGEPMPDDQLVDNLLTFVAAGHETTALALAWTFRLLADHPVVERQVLDEIAATGSDFVREPHLVDRLVYTKQVIQEAMRLYPPAPLMVRRTAREIQLGNTRIPAGQSVHVPIYALHRHRQIWSQPDTFDPDRFAPENQGIRDRYAYLPFGAGPRVCIGMGMALTECIVVLATLLPAFRMRATSSVMPDARFRVTLRPQGGMPMYVEPRER